MASFSVAKVNSACDTIVNRTSSVSAELAELLKVADPANTSTQHLLSLSEKLHQFQRTVESLRQALADASVISEPIRSTLEASLLPCSDCAAIIAKQINRISPDSILRFNPEVLLEYEEHQVVNINLFEFLSQSLKL
jgi:hypothetical protein